MPHLLLLQWHPMAGLDFHDDVMPEPPFDVPFEPHLVFSVLQGEGMPEVEETITDETVMADGMQIILRNSDILLCIPHIPLGPGFLLMPLLELVASSKSYFGPESVQAAAAGGEKHGPVAAQLIPYCPSPQGNCNEVLEMPTGLTFPWGTVVTDLTLNDILAGLFTYCVDAFVGALLCWLPSKYAASKLAESKLGEWSDRVWSPIELTEPVAQALMQQAVGVPAAWFENGPGDWGGKAEEALTG